MSHEERQNLAKSILENPLFEVFMAEMEAMSVNQIVAAKGPDHEARQAIAADIRAIRAFRQRLRVAAGDQPSTGVSAPA